MVIDISDLCSAAGNDLECVIMIPKNDHFLL